MEVKERLIEETNKWLEKVKAERTFIILLDQKKTDFLDNIDAYISDSEFFLENEDFVEAFEAVVWSWAYLEIGIDIGILGKKN